MTYRVARNGYLHADASSNEDIGQIGTPFSMKTCLGSLLTQADLCIPFRRRACGAVVGFRLAGKLRGPGAPDVLNETTALQESFDIPPMLRHRDDRATHHSGRIRLVEPWH